MYNFLRDFLQFFFTYYVYTYNIYIFHICIYDLKIRTTKEIRDIHLECAKEENFFRTFQIRNKM